MMGPRPRFWIALALGSVLGGCQVNPVECGAECMENWLDGPRVRDTADLVSVLIPNPAPEDLNTPVVIAAHGFTATSYEWEEFHRHARDRGVLVSRILLGGHGTSLEDFENSGWRDWGRPILEEYRALSEKGYRHISLIGSSTGGTLILQHVHDHAFDAAPVLPEHVFLVDPFLVPMAKLLTVVKIAGPFLGNDPNENDSLESRHWYVNRPAGQLEQLYDLANKVKNELEGGFRLPAGSRCKLWKSDGDPVADPIGALLIYKGLHHADGRRIDVGMVRSRLHVFTRLQGRRSLTAEDSALQAETFREILALVKE